MMMLSLVKSIERIIDEVADPQQRRHALQQLLEQSQTDVIEQDQWNLVLARLSALEAASAVSKADSQAANEKLAVLQDRVLDLEGRLIPRGNPGHREELPPG